MISIHEDTPFGCMAVNVHIQEKSGGGKVAAAQFRIQAVVCPERTGDVVSYNSSPTGQTQFTWRQV